jgi:hypothetical protein
MWGTGRSEAELSGGRSGDTDACTSYSEPVEAAGHVRLVDPDPLGARHVPLESC